MPGACACARSRPAPALRIPAAEDRVRQRVSVLVAAQDEQPQGQLLGGLDRGGARLLDGVHGPADPGRLGLLKRLVVEIALVDLPLPALDVDLIGPDVAGLLGPVTLTPLARAIPDPG